MKKYFWLFAIGVFLFTACGSDDDEKKADDLTVEKLAGLWVTDYAQNATEDGKTWTRVVADFLFRADGTGYWECFLLDADKLVSAEADRGNDATHFTISGNTVTVSLDNSITKWTLTYADGKLTDTEDGTVYQKAATAQQTLVEQLYSDWQGMNSGKEDDGSTVSTPVTDQYTDEPARARQQ